MMRLLILCIVLLLAAFSTTIQPALAQGATHVTGGGTATFNADLDGDGQEDGSQFGMGVILHADGSARGHFNCVMGGQSEFLDLALMSVAGKVSSGNINPDGSAVLSGTGAVKVIAPDGNPLILTDIPFVVTVTAGGPGVGTLRLTVMGIFDGVPGDTIPGNGNYDLPTEIVDSGRIDIH